MSSSVTATVLQFGLKTDQPVGLNVQYKSIKSICIVVTAGGQRGLSKRAGLRQQIGFFSTIFCSPQFSAMLDFS